MSKSVSTKSYSSSLGRLNRRNRARPSPTMTRSLRYIWSLDEVLRFGRFSRIEEKWFFDCYSFLPLNTFNFQALRPSSGPKMGSIAKQTIERARHVCFSLTQIPISSDGQTSGCVDHHRLHELLDALQSSRRPQRASH